MEVFLVAFGVWCFYVLLKEGSYRNEGAGNEPSDTEVSEM